MTAAQPREVITRLITARHWHPGDPDILIVFDADYDVSRLAWLLKDLPAELAGGCEPGAVLPGAAGHPGLQPPGPVRRGIRVGGSGGLAGHGSSPAR